MNSTKKDRITSTKPAKSSSNKSNVFSFSMAKEEKESKLSSQSIFKRAAQLNW